LNPEPAVMKIKKNGLMDLVINQCLEDSISAKKLFVEDQSINLKTAIEWIIKAMRTGNKLMICGNGGSAADAQHMAAEFVNRFLLNRPPLPALALSTDSSILTSVGNDFSFDQIFEKQVQALGKENDILLGISTSGNSPNIIRAVEAAKEKDILSIVLTGGSGGKLIDLADLTLNVPSSRTPHIQEAHIWAVHCICQLVDEELYGK
jgi:D-sedoheptulose 7-phosphate isomerase